VAPRKQPFQRRGSQSPNTVLVIFLIFFILATIVTGVMAYYGYAGQADLRKKATDAETNAKAARNAEEWALFQSRLARSALGDPLYKDENLDEDNFLKVALDDFVTPTGTVNPDTKFKGEKTRPKIEEMFNKAKQDLGWNSVARKFQTTYRDKGKKLETELAKAQGDYNTALTEKDQVQHEMEKLAAKRKQTFDQIKKSIDAGNKEALDAANARTEAMNQLLKDNTDLKRQLDTQKEQYETTLRKKNGEIRNLQTEMANFKKEVALAGTDVATPAAQTSGAGQPHPLLLDISQGHPLWDRPLAKIARVEPEGRRVYINKGSDAGLKPQMTFLVFAAGPGGRAEGQLKGTVEVQQVLDRNNSLGRITSLYDLEGKEVPLTDSRRGNLSRQGENPIRQGDLLFNLAWGAHVAIAGAPNSGGAPGAGPAEQMRELRQFKLLLQREGATVDAYLDLQDGQVKGSITPKTNFLIRGELPLERPGADAAGATSKLTKTVNEVAAKMATEAVTKGLFIISADNFLHVIGYRPTRSAEDSELTGFQPRLPFAGSGLRGSESAAGGKQ
jgi:hypothetical protein